jgi:2-succinyl-5-enolpyruvyl-6-hydroxy-3-cyclohexene-1-carboxylate synthase
MPPHGVVVAGRLERDSALGTAVAEFAGRFGYPLLADPLSRARSGPAAIARYDLLLRDDAFAASVRPELVIRVGDLPTSKPLRGWLASLADVPQIALDPEGAWQNPGAELSGDLAVAPEAFFRAAKPVAPADRDWLASWRAADAAVDRAVTGTLGDELSEPRVAAALGEWLPAEATLFVASSMPVRDVEEFFPVRADPPRVLSNRGANGIDGTVSAAFGAAAVAGGPVVLLIGDVALAHDIGGLLAARRLGVALTIVLINNDGGGIFHFLPVSGEDDAFEEHVATPHALDFAHAAALYGCGYDRATDLAALRAKIDAGIASPDTTIIEIRTERGQNLALHRLIADAARAAVGD